MKGGIPLQVLGSFTGGEVVKYTHDKDRNYSSNPFNPFGPIWCAAGTLNFFGEGYPFHRWFKLLFPKGFTPEKLSFVSKSVTLEPVTGRMPLKGTQPRERFPKCVYVDPLKGIALNAVGLSCPGAVQLFEQGIWQQRTEPFQISFASPHPEEDVRVEEFRKFTELFRKHSSDFKTEVGLQVNVSCPNTEGHSKDNERSVSEARRLLDIAGTLDVKAIVKLSVTLPPVAAKKIADHPACWGICISNTIPWGAMPESIDWSWYSYRSPLRRRGIDADGGLSGAPLLPLVSDWVHWAREEGISCHINACGGILHYDDVARLCMMDGADSVSIATMALVRPWRIRRTIQSANTVRPLLEFRERCAQ